MTGQCGRRGRARRRRRPDRATRGRGAGRAGRRHASHVVTSVSAVVAVPSGVSTEVLAACMESSLTLVFGTTHRVSVSPGEQVVVLGAGGAVGLAAVDVARSLGAEVTAVASTASKRESSLHAGATTALGYDDLKDRLCEATGGGRHRVRPRGRRGRREVRCGLWRRADDTASWASLPARSSGYPPTSCSCGTKRHRDRLGRLDPRGGRSVREHRPARRSRRTADRRCAHPQTPSVARLSDAAAVFRRMADRDDPGRYVLRP